MDIPVEELKPETLQALVEEFVNREGTDYGENEPSLDSKVSEVIDQIKKGSAVIRYDPDTETCGVFSIT
jgi:uncharacterized protein